MSFSKILFCYCLVYIHSLELGLQVVAIKESDRTCCLTLDELSIKTALQYDSSSGVILGNVSLPHHKPTPATKALVFMLSGIRIRWKQVVAYYYTGMNKMLFVIDTS